MQESAVAGNTKPKPALNLLKLTRQALLLRAKRLKRLFRSEVNVHVSKGIPKHYERPTARKLTLEQARLLALGHPAASEEDGEFMRVLFPDQPKPG